VAVGDESFVVAGIDFWNVDGPNLHEPRLEKDLQVQGFVTPPASDDEKHPDVPVVRFPRWHSCPSCHRLAPHHLFTTFDGNQCGLCEELLIPSRFIIACPRGHIDDFPYYAWVHAGTTSSPGVVHDLRLETAGLSASLRDVVVACSCGKEMTLEGAFRSTALRGVSRCGGERPWLGQEAKEHCEETPRTLQRGASNVWYPALRSALSIPPWSEGAYRALNKYWFIVKAVPTDALRATIAGLGIAAKVGYSVDELVEAVIARKADEGAGGADEIDLRRQEFDALVRGRPELSSGQDFVCVPVRTGDAPIASWFDLVMTVPRLREVRALDAFTRVIAPEPSDPPERRASVYLTDPGWRPAMEVAGEGVFIRLSTSRLQEWEGRREIKQRAGVLDQRYRAKFADLGKPADRQITPRFVLLHTLAHLLVSQWSLECGYPAASLRERIYADSAMAGILIYTATSDSAGSLGGVVGLAEPNRLESAVEEMLARAAWCSSDPLCGESEGSGVDSLNLAACHACSLLPETSCEEMNLLLDRALVSDVPGAQGFGYFTSQV
jgi:hypothetical protein